MLRHLRLSSLRSLTVCVDSDLSAGIGSAHSACSVRTASTATRHHRPSVERYPRKTRPLTSNRLGGEVGIPHPLRHLSKGDRWLLRKLQSRSRQAPKAHSPLRRRSQACRFRRKPDPYWLTRTLHQQCGRKRSLRRMPLGGRNELGRSNSRGRWLVP